MLKISCGTLAYMAPEVVKKQEYNGFAADIWALGILLYIMLTCKHPFKSKNDRDLQARIIVGEITPTTSISFDAMRLITKMLSLDASKRPKAS